MRIPKMLMAGAIIGAITTYYLTGERGARNRRRLRNWAMKTRSEVMDRYEDSKIPELISDLKKHWEKFIESARE